jgi:peptidoglycan/xylan/chitin deacetylase (PgdA/CDA1 family)
VIMLHRVIDPADPDFTASDPTYTLSVPLFEQLLEFLRDHYAVVSLRDVMVASDGAGSLPDHAVLITFDDGWADNLRYAAPLLQARGLPAVVFAVPDAILAPGDRWWQEQVFAAGRAGKLPDGGSALDLVARLVPMEADQRAQILASVPAGPCHARMMLTPEEVPQLAAFGIDVGLHGYSHAPLTMVPDVEAELTRAKQAIATMSGGTATTNVLGCPHGRYDARVIAGAHAAGMKLVFTSDPILNLTRNGALIQPRPIGRINVEARRITDEFQRFNPAAAARWLWARDCR